MNFQESWESTLKYHHRIKKISEPMKDYFGINWISYNKIYCDGTYRHLDNRPEISESYIHLEAFLCDPLLRHPSLLPKGIVLFDDLPSSDYQALVKKKISAMNIDLGFILIEPTPTHVTLLAIGAPQLYPDQLSHYVNELPLIRNFFNYFIDEAHEALQFTEQHPIQLLTSIKDDFYKPDFKQEEQHTNTKRQTFIQHITKKSATYETLTIREKQLLSLLLDGLSAKQIASCLDLSSRTVENYMNILKQKLQCYSKSALIAKARELYLSNQLS